MSTERMTNYLNTLSTYQRHSFYSYFIGAISAMVTEEAMDRATDIAIEAMKKQGELASDTDRMLAEVLLKEVAA